jgi:hypothetical protein
MLSIYSLYVGYTSKSDSVHRGHVKNIICTSFASGRRRRPSRRRRRLSRRHRTSARVQNKIVHVGHTSKTNSVHRTHVNK